MAVPAPICAIILVSLLLSGCRCRGPEPGVDEGALRRHAMYLADDSLAGRNGGYDGENLAALYIAEELRVLGLEPAGDGGTYFQGFSFQPRFPEHPGQTLDSQNIVAILRGSRRVESVEPVVVGAHYDGQGMAGQADPGREFTDLVDSGDDIWNSANDNGPRTHTPDDEPESLSYSDLVWRAELVATTVEELSLLESKPEFASAFERVLPFIAVAASPGEIQSAGLDTGTRALRVAAILRQSLSAPLIEVGELIVAFDGEPVGDDTEYEIHRLFRENFAAECLPLVVVSGNLQREICL